jgi:hypothetical protein
MSIVLQQESRILRATFNPNWSAAMHITSLKNTVSADEWQLRTEGAGIAWPALLRKLDRADASYKS